MISYDNQFKISVILPVYNMEQHLGRCIESILGQSFKDYQLILIDDGSTDKSGQICDDYSQKYEHINVFHQENRGLAGARATGLELAIGKYVTFIDSDDYIHPDYLRILYDGLMDVDMVRCRLISVTEESAFSDLMACSYTDAERAGVVCDRDTLIRMFYVDRAIASSVCGMMVRRELFDGLDMCIGAVPGEEVCTSVQLFDRIETVRILQCGLYFYWQNQGGISRSGYTPRHRKGLEKYIEYCNIELDRYPQYKLQIAAYFLEHEMAVITAMARNNTYDNVSIKMIKSHLREHLGSVLKNNRTEKIYKYGALMIVVNVRMFGLVFKTVRKKYGR